MQGVACLVQGDSHAAREDGGEQAAGLFGDEDDDGLGRGLFQGFEEGIGGFFHHAVGFLDDDELGFTFICAQCQEGFDIADVFDENFAAFGARAQHAAHRVAQGFERIGPCAVELCCHGQGELVGAGAGGAGEEQGMWKPAALAGVKEELPGLVQGK